MNKIINRSQLERLITECVQDTLAESRYMHSNNRRVMNEAQLQNYVRKIINEELENEWGLSNITNGARTAFNNIRRGRQDNETTGGYLKRTWDNMRDNWNDQTKYDNITKARQLLQQLVQDGSINTEMKVADIINFKGNTLTSYKGRLKQGMNRRGLK